MLSKKSLKSATQPWSEKNSVAEACPRSAQHHLHTLKKLRVVCKNVNRSDDRILDSSSSILQ